MCVSICNYLYSCHNLLYMTSVSPSQWVLIQELPGSVRSLSPGRLEVPWSPQSPAQNNTSHSEHMREAHQLRKLRMILPGIFIERITHSNFNSKSPRKMFRKKDAVEIQFGSQKRNQWGWKCNTSRSLAWTKLRGMADKQQSIIHRWTWTETS